MTATPAPALSDAEQATVDRFEAADPAPESFDATVERVANWLCKEYGELLDGDAEAPAGYWEFQARELLEVLAPQAEQ